MSRILVRGASPARLPGGFRALCGPSQSARPQDPADKKGEEDSPPWVGGQLVPVPQKGLRGLNFALRVLIPTALAGNPKCPFSGPRGQISGLSAQSSLCHSQLNVLPDQLLGANKTRRALLTNQVGGVVSGHDRPPCHPVDLASQPPHREVLACEVDRRVAAEGVVTTLAGSSGGYADGTGASAKFENPNAKRTCGCGESFSV